MIDADAVFLDRLALVVERADLLVFRMTVLKCKTTTPDREKWLRIVEDCIDNAGSMLGLIERSADRDAT